MRECRCGCGQTVTGRRVFVDKEHQLDWMRAGGARELNALQPVEAKALGGSITGREAHRSGRLAEAAKKGGQRSREIAERHRPPGK
jgi:general stress protein YciG